MTITINPFGADFAAEITGLDISQPIDDAMRDEIVAAIDQYATVVIRGEAVSQDAQIAFAKRFGPLDAQNGVLTTDIQRRVSAQLVDISNMDEAGRLLDLQDRRRLFNLGNQLWHTDSSFKRLAAKYSMLHAHSVSPQDGETQVCDLRAAYDAALSEVDLLLMPTSPIVASKLPAPDATPEQATRAAWEMLSNTSAFNITGHPSMSSPCGLSDGLPVGMMLTGKHWDEATIYRAAHAFEQAGDWRDI